MRDHDVLLTEAIEEALAEKADTTKAVIGNTTEAEGSVEGLIVIDDSIREEVTQEFRKINRQAQMHRTITNVTSRTVSIDLMSQKHPLITAACPGCTIMKMTWRTNLRLKR